jgi:hypothetical protein
MVSLQPLRKWSMAKSKSIIASIEKMIGMGPAKKKAKKKTKAKKTKKPVKKAKKATKKKAKRKTKR